MTTQTPSNAAAPQKLNKWLSIIHFCLLFGVVGFAFGLNNKYDTNLSLGFALTALGVVMTSMGVITMSKAAQKVLIVASMIVAAAGVVTFSKGLKSAGESGPGIFNVTLDFSSEGYSVEGLNAIPCLPADETKPLQFTCKVKVTPLANLAADQSEAPATP